MEEGKKLTYEQLEAYANQLVTMNKKAADEIKALRIALTKVQTDSNIQIIECALKCIEHKDMFSKSFISSIVSRIEETLTVEEVEDGKGDK